MDFSRIPDTAFLLIVRQLPFRERGRLNRVNKSFKRISEIAISQTKSLILCDEDISTAAAQSLTILLDLCGKNLEKITFPRGIRCHSLMSVFARYSCPRLQQLDLGSAEISNDTLEILLRNNNFNLRNLIWRPFDNWLEYPNILTEKLISLNIGNCNNDSLLSLIDRCPNLKCFETRIYCCNEDVMEEFFANYSRLEKLDLSMINNRFVVENLINFWSLQSLDELTLNIGSYSKNGDTSDRLNDQVLIKIADSFPRLNMLNLDGLSITNYGVASLSSLRELRKLKFTDNKGDDINDGLNRLAKQGRLEKVKFDFDLISTTLISLIRSCSQLSYVCAKGIKDAQTADQAATIVQSLVGIGPRDVNVSISHREYKNLWKTETVEMALKQVRESDGVTINFSC